MTKLYESQDEAVSHPKHYALIPEKGIEVIDVIKAATQDLYGIFATDTGNIIKYSLRWNKKNGKQDVEKIIYYATHLLRELEMLEEDPATTAEYQTDMKCDDEDEIYEEN